MKLFHLLMLILLECFLVLMAFMPKHIDSKSHAQAFFNYRQNLTPETERIWQEANRIYKRQMAMTDNILLVMIFLNAGAIIWTAMKVKKMAQPPSSGYRPPAAGSA